MSRRRLEDADDRKSTCSVSLTWKLQKIIDGHLDYEQVTRSEWIEDAIMRKLEYKKIRGEIINVKMQEKYGGTSHVKRKVSNILIQDLKLPIPKEIAEKLRIWAMPRGVEYEEAVTYILADFFGLIED